MPDQKTIPQRIVSWLHGDDLAARREAKGLFAYDETMRWYNSPYVGPQTPLYTGDYFGSDVNYAVEAGDLIDNTAAMACMLWVCRTFPEAPLVVKRVSADATEKIVPRHSMAQKVRRPNPYYSGMLLWNATLLSFNWNGNAYWRKVRNAQGQVIQLYWEPHWTMRPVRASGNEYISKYQIWRDREWRDVPLQDVVHFRYGIDPRNDMCGLSPLASALREVYTDNQAARYASAMFRNKGQIGGLITPKDPNDDISGMLPRFKEEMRQLTTGDNVGSWVGVSAPVDFTFPPSDPSKMDTRGNRKITEERISALLGVPAIVAGLGAGLDRSTFANMAEAREAAYEGNIIPTQAMLADELDIQLLPDFGNPDSERTGWDYSQVRVLQDDENKKAQRWAILWNAGLVKRKDALADMDLPYDDIDDDVYKNQSQPQQPAQLPPAQPTDTQGQQPPQPIEDTVPAKTLALAVHTNGHGAQNAMGFMGVMEARTALMPKGWITLEDGRHVLVGEGDGGGGDGAASNQVASSPRVMNAKEAQTWAKENYKKPSAMGMNKDQAQALETYTSGSFVHINNYQRTGQLPKSISKEQMDTFTNHMDSALAHSPLPEDVQVVRGMSLRAFGGRSPDDMVGTTLNEKGYMSTSVGKQVHENFADAPVHMTMNVPKGTPAYYTANVSRYPQERELTLGRSSNYVIRSASYDKANNRWNVHADVLPKGGKAK